MKIMGFFVNVNLYELRYHAEVNKLITHISSLMFEVNLFLKTRCF